MAAELDRTLRSEYDVADPKLRIELEPADRPERGFS